jgi:hypothetical protein
VLHAADGLAVALHQVEQVDYCVQFLASHLQLQ